MHRPKVCTDIRSTLMEKFKFEIISSGQAYQFEAAEYPHHEDEKCRFEVFKEGVFVAGYEPDKNEVVRLCKNPGVLPSTLLHTIAEYLQEYQI
jgi:hypothetical protein